MEATFFKGDTKYQTLKGMEPYYAAIRSAAAQITTHHEKQTFLKVIYENFYKVYNPKAADRLGVIYKDFWQWAEWGKELMDLHIGYESVTPAKLKRIDLPDEKARKAGLPPKCILKADKDGGRIIVDSETTLTGIPSEAWDYRLGNRSGSNGFSTSTKKRDPKTQPSAQSSTPTASPTTKRK